MKAREAGGASDPWEADGGSSIDPVGDPQADGATGIDPDGFEGGSGLDPNWSNDSPERRRERSGREGRFLAVLGSRVAVGGRSALN